MKNWRRESVLDLYNLVLAAVLFVSPGFSSSPTAREGWIFGPAVRRSRRSRWRQ